jgi:DNA-binding IclR family transcriptional regulator
VSKPAPIAVRSARSLTVEKALQLLRAVADQPAPISLMALSRSADLDKATTHRLATSLARHGLLRFDPVTRTYALGLGLVDLGSRAIAQLNLPREARPYLERLGSLGREAVNLGVWDDASVVYVDQVPSPEPVVIQARVGTRVPAYCTSMGKVLLAFGQPAWLEQVLGAPELPARTPNTIVEPSALAEHLAAVRRRGYAFDEEENREGVRCVAAPIRDFTGAAIAAVSIAGPAFRLSRERLEELVAPLLEATGALSASLGLRDGGPPASAAGC